MADTLQHASNLLAAGRDPREIREALDAAGISTPLDSLPPPDIKLCPACIRWGVRTVACKDCLEIAEAAAEAHDTLKAMQTRQLSRAEWDALPLLQPRAPQVFVTRRVRAMAHKSGKDMWSP